MRRWFLWDSRPPALAPKFKRRGPGELPPL